MNEAIRSEVLSIINDVKYSPLSFIELLDQIDCSEEDLKETLQDLIDNYDIFMNKKGDKYLSSRNVHMYKGTISIKNNLFGFVTNDYYPDIFVPGDSFNQAMNKDYVLYHIDLYTGEAVGEVIKVLKHHYEYLVGTLSNYKNKYYLIPNDKYITQDILVKDVNGAKKNDIVRVKIDSYGDYLKTHVVDILGDINTIGIDITMIASSYGCYREFSEDVINYTNDIQINIEDEKKRRKSYDDKLIFTIDSLSAKDLDDAVSVEILPNGNYELGVYIADVSYYVKEDSVLDLEARARGTSVYLLDRVIPMLPVRLSNDLCSLNPNEEKLVISCIMEIDNKGDAVDVRVEEGIIKTTKRLSYEVCNEVLENGTSEHPDYEICLDSLKKMIELAKILNEKREKRGSIDFDTIEPEIILDKEGKAIDIVVKPRGESERIIEEFMIKANESIAELISSMDLPFIYRVHDKPDNIKFQTLKNFVSGLGYKLLSSHPMEIQKLLNNLDENDIYLKNSIIRLMAKAIYSSENIGHFGLASEYYTHFTSPIRRYPDLLVHRLIRKYLFNNDNILNDKEYHSLKSKIDEIAYSSSEAERSAMNCEFAVIDMKKAEYMSQCIGEVYTGVISSIHSFGIFVGLDNTVEGLIRKEELKLKGFYYNNQGYYLNERRNTKLKLGDKVKIRVKNANKKLSEIDFELVYNNGGVRYYGRKNKNNRKK
ncbi:MAG: ribonuclease R [Bacilli bacterium]|nr:ribonuclease R [Bacilli bacterium]